MATPTAKINITIVNFNGLRDISDPTRFCIISDPVIVNNAGGRVRNDVNGDARTFRVSNGKEDPNDHAEKAKPVNLEFTILPAGSYVIAGIVFDKEGLAEVHGKKSNFKILAIKNNVITIRDHYTVGRTFWDFFIAVQQTAQPGAIGVIDPGVENSEDA